MTTKLVLATVAFALVASTAARGDASTTIATMSRGTEPAGNCWERGKGTGSFDRNEYRITNSGTTTRPLLCPIDARSYPISVEQECAGGFLCSSLLPFFPGRLNVKVRIQDQNSAADMSCSLMARNQNGSAVETDTAWTSGTGLQTLDLEVVMDHDRAYVLKCNMPANGSSGYISFHTYRVELKRP